METKNIIYLIFMIPSISSAAWRTAPRPNPGVFISSNPVLAAAAGITVVQSTGIQNHSASTIVSSTFSSAAGGGAGTLLWLAISAPGEGSFNACIDNKNNVYTDYGARGDASVSLQIWASSAPTAGTTWIKCTSGTSDTYSIAIHEISGITQSTGTAVVWNTATSQNVNTSTMSFSGNQNVTLCSAALNSGTTPVWTAPIEFTTRVKYPDGTWTQIFTWTNIGTTNISCFDRLSASLQWYALGQSWR